MTLRSVGPWLVLLVLGCPSNPGEDTGEGTTAADSTAGESEGDGNAGGELLGCPSGGCTMLLAVQTLDDRIEVFVPDHPDSAYRGAISMDLKPNECEGCGL